MILSHRRNKVDFILLVIVLGNCKDLVGTDLEDLGDFLRHRLEVSEGGKAEPDFCVVGFFDFLFQLSGQFQL